MHVYIDREKCEASTNCLDAAPEVFGLDETDVAFVLEGQPTPDQEEAVRRAARLCPVGAVIIEE